MNDGSTSKPYFMPKGLMQFVVKADYDLTLKRGKTLEDENMPLRTMQYLDFVQDDIHLLQ